jgi:putative endonuclease
VQNNSKIYGAEGEEKAAKYLVEQGYKILERNWRFRHLEIDIIASKDREIVFVEVKTRKNLNFGAPELFVSRKQQNFLISAANYYLISKDLDIESRFDIVAIWRENNEYIIKHLEGAFYAAGR